MFAFINFIRALVRFFRKPAAVRDFTTVELLRYDAGAFDCIHVETAIGKDATNFIDREIATTGIAIEAERLAKMASLQGGYYGVTHNGILVSLYFEGRCKNITYIP